MKFLGLLLALPIYFVGCAYTTQSVIPSHVNSIAIPLFENKTFKLSKNKRSFKRRVGKLLTDQVIERFLEDGRLDVVSSENAQWILEGRVVSYDTRPIRYSRLNLNVVEEVYVSLSVLVTLRDSESGQVIWQDREISREDDVFVTGSFVEAEKVALAKIMRDMAKDIWIQVAEGWY